MVTTFRPWITLEEYRAIPEADDGTRFGWIESAHSVTVAQALDHQDMLSAVYRAAFADEEAMGLGRA